jgi:hypothetical protein
MGDKQNPTRDDEDSAQTPANGSEVGNRGEAPRSYYYDDATGYEIYKQEDESDEDVDGQDG